MCCTYGLDLEGMCSKRSTWHDLRTWFLISKSLPRRRRIEWWQGPSLKSVTERRQDKFDLLQCLRIRFVCGEMKGTKYEQWDTTMWAPEKEDVNSGMIKDVRSGMIKDGGKETVKNIGSETHQLSYENARAFGYTLLKLRLETSVKIKGKKRKVKINLLQTVIWNNFCFHKKRTNIYALAFCKNSHNVALSSSAGLWLQAEPKNQSITLAARKLQRQHLVRYVAVCNLGRFFVKIRYIFSSFCGAGVD